jgi:hypothetical protein
MEEGQSVADQQGFGQHPRAKYAELRVPAHVMQDGLNC